MGKPRPRLGSRLSRIMKVMVELGLVTSRVVLTPRLLQQDLTPPCSEFWSGRANVLEDFITSTSPVRD